MLHKRAGFLAGPLPGVILSFKVLSRLLTLFTGSSGPGRAAAMGRGPGREPGITGITGITGYMPPCVPGWYIPGWCICLPMYPGGVYPGVCHPMYTLCTPGCIPPYVHPMYTRVHHPARGTPAAVASCPAPSAVPGVGALGSRREKPAGEGSSSRSDAKKCHSSKARARRITRVPARVKHERLDSARYRQGAGRLVRRPGSIPLLGIRRT